MSNRHVAAATGPLDDASIFIFDELLQGSSVAIQLCKKVTVHIITNLRKKENKKG